MRKLWVWARMRKGEGCEWRGARGRGERNNEVKELKKLDRPYIIYIFDRCEL